MNDDIKKLIDSDNIVITIHNYKGQNIIYSMPEDGIVEIWKSQIVTGQNAGAYNQVGIEITCSNGIEIIEEDLY